MDIKFSKEELEEIRNACVWAKHENDRNIKALEDLRFLQKSIGEGEYKTYVAPLLEQRKIIQQVLMKIH